MWFWGLLSIVVVIAIFFGTINIVPKSVDDDLWVKVKLSINSDTCVGWCRVIPGKEVRFYKIDGSLVDLKKNKVRVVERCIESSIDHPIPQEG